MLPKFEISVWCMLRNTLLKLRSLNFQDSLLGGLDSRAEPGRGPAELVLYYKDKDGMLPKLDISVSLSFCNIFLKSCPLNFQDSLLCRVDSNAGPGRGPAECVLYTKNKDGVLPKFESSVFCILCNTFLKLCSLNFQDPLLRGLDPRAGPGRGPAELVYYHKNKDGMLPKLEISVTHIFCNTFLK